MAHIILDCERFITWEFAKKPFPDGNIKFGKLFNIVTEYGFYAPDSLLLPIHPFPFSLRNRVMA
jgi:uncharacterized protein (DUF3820 family)